MAGADQDSARAGGKGGALMGAGAGLLVLGAAGFGLWFATAPSAPVTVAEPASPGAQQSVPASAASEPQAAAEVVSTAPVPEVGAPPAVSAPAAIPEEAEAAPEAREIAAVAEPEARGAAVAPAEAETAAVAPEPGALPTGADSAAAPAPVAAQFDALRVTSEGALTLAGRVAPAAEVVVLLDGAPIATTTADAQGAFALLADIVPAAEPRMVQLRVTGADGVARLAPQSLTVAPSPLAMAQAATEEGAPAQTVAANVAAAQVLAAKPLLTDAAGGARVLAAPAETLGIDTLAFDAAGGIAISGRGAPEGALLRAYVDGAEAGLVQAGAGGGWAMQLPQAAPGAHVLRVDALDAGGAVLARAEQSFEGIAPPALETAARAALPARAPEARTDPASEPAEAAAPNSAPPPVPNSAPNPVPVAPAAPVMRAVTITPGNTLWAIAREAYGDPYLYVQIFEANRAQIRDPNMIYPGQVFTLPN
ncbi:LysM peptidoglycan-binding domain-containing protein [Rhodobacter lacus]|uniref:LysM peptidoglycan-binding domain-containing protein n=1 Tax=Rhodobacter lacus TaxID=1641972 RepID=A0ABW5ACV1_9RHOB